MGKSPRADATSMVAIFNTAVRQNIGILTGKLASARFFFAHVRFEAETHAAMYSGPRADENSRFPHFHLDQALHTNGSSLRRRGC